jgi:hydroxymethylglutaryl-CoA lyase
MKNIKIHEVGMRDGLQNEKKVVPFEMKVEWFEKLIAAKVDILQIGSFVHTEKMPQMADTDKLFEHFIGKSGATILSGLVLNARGYERAVACGCEMICFGVSASETHSMKNTRKTTEEALTTIIESAKQAIDDGKKVQCSIQSAFGCGFEGKIDENRVVDIAKRYVDNGIFNISLADTAGHAYPEQVKRLISKIKEYNENVAITVHFHNTFGLGITNCYYAIESGAEYIETAFGGLGGCPFTKVAAGNVCTEDLIYSLNRENKIIDCDINQIIEVTRKAETFFDKTLEGYIYKTLNK